MSSCRQPLPEIYTRMKRVRASIVSRVEHMSAAESMVKDTQMEHFRELVLKLNRIVAFIDAFLPTVERTFDDRSDSREYMDALCCDLTNLCRSLESSMSVSSVAYTDVYYITMMKKQLNHACTALLDTWCDDMTHGGFTIDDTGVWWLYRTLLVAVGRIGSVTTDVSVRCKDVLHEQWKLYIKPAIRKRKRADNQIGKHVQCD